MKRRLYFLFPDSEHARSVVNELEAHGIRREFVHAIAGRGGELNGLPTASANQQQDLGSRIENFLWDGNLTVFSAALTAIFIMVLMQLASYWLLLPIGIMLLSFVIGLNFVTRIPNVHLAEFQDALRHREILLMVDVPTARVTDVETLVQRRHPEAVVGGVGWNLGALQL